MTVNALLTESENVLIVYLTKIYITIVLLFTIIYDSLSFWVFGTIPTFSNLTLQKLEPLQEKCAFS